MYIYCRRLREKNVLKKSKYFLSYKSRGYGRLLKLYGVNGAFT